MYGCSSPSNVKNCPTGLLIIGYTSGSNALVCPTKHVQLKGKSSRSDSGSTPLAFSCSYALTDRAVCTVSTDNDVTLVDVAVGGEDGDAVFVFGDGLDALPEMNLVRRDLFEEELMKLRACDDVLSISCSTSVREEVYR